jgi:serine/threonine-protein kinase
MTEVPAAQVRQQLARILQSRAFANAERLRRFLQFSVDAALAGGPGPKEYVIAVEVCGRPADFDSTADPIVRVDASRLRSRLGAYYANEGQHDPVRIELPKGSYVARFAAEYSPGQAALSTAAAPAAPSLAVLPFVNLRSDTDSDFFSDGITEELINVLSRGRELRVVARTSVFQFKGRAADVREIGRQLGATHVLEGSVREAAGRIRVTAQLTEASTGWLLWADKFERELTEVFAIQDEICARLAATLRVRLVEGSDAERPDLEAHRSYLRGRHHANRRTPDSLAKSVTCYRAALDRDPAYPLPYSGLADALTVQALDEQVDPAEALPQAKAYAARALEISPGLPEALVSAAFIASVWEWDWDAAEAGFTRAIEASPSSATAHHLYAVVNLAPRARFDEALRVMARAVELDPISAVVRRDLGVIHYLRRDYEQAEVDLRDANELDPAFVGHLYWLARTLAEQGRLDEAEAALRARAATRSNTRVQAVLADILARKGRRAEAEQILTRLESGSGHDRAPATSLAIARLALGEHDLAIDRLATAVDRRMLTLYQMAVDPLYDPLRSDSRFQELLASMKLRRK